MKYNSILVGLFFLIFAANSCGQDIKTDFPEKIITKKSENQIRIKGTKVFCTMPKDFYKIEGSPKYQKNENTYIVIMETTAPFSERKKLLTKEAIEAKGAKMDFSINVSINEYEAVYAEGPSKVADETKLLFAFGNDSFYVFIGAAFKTNDNEGKKELQEILKSIYYDKKVIVDPLETSNFEFDLSITNFKFAIAASNIYIYTKVGSESQDTSGNAIQIAGLPYMSDNEAENDVKNYLNKMELRGSVYKNKNITKTKINGYSAFINETSGTYKNNNYLSYLVVLIGEKSGVFFNGITYDDTENLLLKYKKTVETIKIK